MWEGPLWVAPLLNRWTWVVCTRKQAEKPVSSIHPWPLLQFLAYGLLAHFLARGQWHAGCGGRASTAAKKNGSSSCGLAVNLSQLLTSLFFYISHPISVFGQNDYHNVTLFEKTSGFFFLSDLLSSSNKEYKLDMVAHIESQHLGGRRTEIATSSKSAWDI